MPSVTRLFIGASSIAPDYTPMAPGLLLTVHMLFAGLTAAAFLLAQASVPPSALWPPPPVTVPSIGSPGAPPQPLTVPSIGSHPGQPTQPGTTPSLGSSGSPPSPPTVPSIGSRPGEPASPPTVPSIGSVGAPPSPEPSASYGKDTEQYQPPSVRSQ